MTLPETRQLLADKIGLLFKYPMAAFLNDASFSRNSDRLRAIEAVAAERPMTGPSEHWYSELGFSEFARLLCHLRYIPVVVQARSKIPGLLHLPNVLLYFLLWYGDRIIGEIAEEMAEILLLAPLDQKSHDIHVHVHSEMPVS